MMAAGEASRSAVWIAADLERRVQGCRDAVATLQQLGDALWRETDELGIHEVEAAVEALQGACRGLEFVSPSFWAPWSSRARPPARLADEVAALRSCCLQLQVQLSAFLLRYDSVRTADRAATAEFTFEAGSLRQQEDKACADLCLLYEDLQQKYEHAQVDAVVAVLDRIREHARGLSHVVHELDAVCKLAQAVERSVTRIGLVRGEVVGLLERQLPAACDSLLARIAQLQSDGVPRASHVRGAEEARYALEAELAAARTAIAALHGAQQELQGVLTDLREHAAAVA